MAYVISDSCVMCGACAGGCPVGAISEGDAQYQIDADACIDCGCLRRYMSYRCYRRGLIIFLSPY